MKRALIVLVAVYCLIAVGGPLHAQQEPSAPAESSAQTGTWLTSLFGPLSGNAYFDYLRGIELRPWVGAGYQRQIISLSIPIPLGLPGYGPLQTASALDLQLLEGDLWIGAAGADAIVNDLFSLSVNAAMNAMKTVKIATAQQPFFPTLVEDVQWEGAKPRWSAIDGNAGYVVWDSLSVVAGIKWEKFTAGLVEPAEATGFLHAWRDLLFPGSWYAGDLQAKLIIPYLGFRIKHANYRATLAGSLFARSDVNVPLRFFTEFIPGVDGTWDDARYRLTNNGRFLQCRFDYDFRAFGSLQMALWAQGSLLRVAGSGTENYLAEESFGGILVPRGAQEVSATAYFSAQSLAAGLSVMLFL
ncbi:MAG: hypothetical protein HY914_21870 [Desulfomonile tiedjei]|nr:hypothetical protein [Desulfomonile tiedjei]